MKHHIKRKCCFAAMVCLILLISAGVNAQQERRRGRPPGDFIEHFDADGDGRVSKSEFPGPDDHFTHLDRNGDGYINADEKPTGPPPQHEDGTGMSRQTSENAIATGSRTDVPYAVVDTGQTACFDDAASVGCPASGNAFFGQDGQYIGNAPRYIDKSDGTITDAVTGLMWQQSPDSNGDGTINVDDKMPFDAAAAGSDALILGGHTDWRLPTIKELYSLIDFSGIDPSGYRGTETAGLMPFINTAFFDFGYGDTEAGERIIDAQFASATKYVSTTMGGNETMFGVNFADGRIKGYPVSTPRGEKTFYVLYVRGNTDYGRNDFQDNGDGTVTDHATGLMWTRSDSGAGMNWQEALAWVAEKNAENHLGYNDWRLPNVKELQSIVDYTRSPDTTGSAAIDPVFSVTAITNEAGQTDFPCFWSGTTHVNQSRTPGGNAAYVAFGRAMGYMRGTWMDVHGAGAQRSDPKSGDPAAWPNGHGPQGDAIRIYNYVRLVRDAE